MVQYQNPTMLNSDSSVYDYELHMPIPTLDFIRKETGVDITVAVGSTTKAASYVRQYTRMAYNILMSKKIQQTRNQIQYLIAVDKEWRNAFLFYVASFLSDIFEAGFIDKLTDITTEDLSFNTKSALTGSLLGIDRLHYFYFEYLKGY